MTWFLLLVSAVIGRLFIVFVMYAKTVVKTFLIISVVIVGVIALYRINRARHANELASIILVTIDTLRADHLGSYGYPRAVSPFIDSLAENGVLFENIFSASSHTAPSHASIFTSLYPFQHGVLRNHEVLDGELFNLHDFFSERGYNVGGLPAVAFLEGKMGFPHLEFEETEQERRAMTRYRYRNAAKMVDRAIEWLGSQDKSAPFFLWLHFYDVHQWQGRGQLPEEYLKRIEAMHDPGFVTFLIENHNTPPDFFGGAEKMVEAMNGYDARVLFVDQQLERLYDYVMSLDRGRNSLWVVTSDHGEGLGNHNYAGHGEFLYNEQLHVPLIFHDSSGKLAARRVEELARTVDIFPTLAALLGQPLSPDSKRLQGVSLRSVLESGKWEGQPTLFAYAERRPKDNKSFRRFWEEGEIRSLQDLRSKYIYHSEQPDEFFDLTSDRFEMNNITGSGRVEERFFSDKLSGLLAESDLETPSHDQEPELTADQVKELMTLGYM